MGLPELSKPEIYLDTFITGKLYKFERCGCMFPVPPFTPPLVASSVLGKPPSDADFQNWAINVLMNGIMYNELWVVRTVVTPPNPPICHPWVTYPYVTLGGVAYRLGNSLAFYGGQSWTIQNPPKRPPANAHLFKEEDGIIRRYS
jgi:hypothetical protein